MNTLTLGSSKLVVKFKHHYSPCLFGIRKDGGFDSFPFGSPVPVFFKNPPTKISGRNQFRAIFTNREAFDKHKKSYFKEDVVSEVKKFPDRYVAPAKFVTECYLYDHEEWLQGAPKIEVNKETGERVVVVRAYTPDSLAVGRSFCSLKEQNFSKKQGRSLALERAKEEYRKKFL